MDRTAGQKTGPGRVASRLALGAAIAALLATCAVAPDAPDAVLAGPDTEVVAGPAWSALDVVPPSDDGEVAEAAGAAGPQDREPGSETTADDAPAEGPDEPVRAADDEQPAPETAADEDADGPHERSSDEDGEPDLSGPTTESAPDLDEVVAARPARVVVPRIGVDNPVVPVGLHPDKSLVVPDEAHVAGWYSGFSRPGQTGRPAVITGHNVWGGRVGVFERLHQLEPGDVIELRGEDDSTVRFEVERIEQHPKDAFPTNRVYDPTDRADLRVITCGGHFDRSRGSHVDNIIAFAVLVD